MIVLARLSLSVAVWCDSDYYGQYCDSFCKGISPMAVCESNGKLSCQPSGEYFITIHFFQNNTFNARITN